MIVTISDTYNLTIGIEDYTNEFHNNLKASSECEIIDCLPHYISWFKFHLPTIHIEPASNVRYVM